MRKKIVILAGPDGAGKTTFANEYLPHEAGCPIFVNADLTWVLYDSMNQEPVRLEEK